LLRGDYARETVFGDDPAAMAKRWVEQGARALHLVDLDGARSGRSDNEAAVEAILAAVAGGGVKVELGGGIRDLAAVERWVGAGIRPGHHRKPPRSRIPAAGVKGRREVSRACLGRHRRARRQGCSVGLDGRHGRRRALGFARDMESRGAAGVIYTDIERDGTREGVNAAATARIAAARRNSVFASGGVSTAADVTSLRSVAGVRIAGVIVGRALYDGAVSLPALLAAAEA
jgi:phosphoribosylformimino-5-aminoimidazole carboxamide ribotide isomerase